MIPKTLVAASLQPIMLSLLARKDMYGYEIIESAKKASGGAIEWTSNKLYPLLHRMEHDGLLTAYWRSSDEGPDRKYYRLTAAGKKHLEAERREWFRVTSLLEDLADPGFAIQ